MDLTTWLLLGLGLVASDFAKVVPSLLGGTYVGTSLPGDQLQRFSEGTDRLIKHQEEIVFRTIQLSTFVATGPMVGPVGRRPRRAAGRRGLARDGRARHSAP